jgi:hypothetical protein
VVPVELGLDSEPGMLDDQVVGYGLIRPGGLSLPLQPRSLGRQRPYPVVQQSAQGVRGRHLRQFKYHEQHDVDDRRQSIRA